MKTLAWKLGILIAGVLVGWGLGVAASRPSPSPPQARPSRPASPVAHDLAARIGPDLRRQVESRRDEIVRNAGGPVARVAVRTGFPVLVREIPTVVEAAIDAALDEFGSLSITQLAERLVEHNRAKGRQAHWSLFGSGPAKPGPASRPAPTQ